MPRRYITQEEKRLIKDRAKGRCEYCQCWHLYAPSSFEVEHIVPIVKGGFSEMENLAFSCGGCNSYKYDKVDAVDPETETIVPLFNPRKEEWGAHFSWSEDTLIILGLTPIGRATVFALRLNRQGLINLRGLFKKEGIHPPE